MKYLHGDFFSYCLIRIERAKGFGDKREYPTLVQ